MKIIELKKRPNIEKNSKSKEAYLQLEKLLNELTKRELPNNMVVSINKELEELNFLTDSRKELKKRIKKKQCNITKSLENELKIVSKNHYRNLWMAVGMAAFGLPFGVAFGSILGNMAFLGIGLPIGMVIGMALGSRMDKKAFEEGRQLALDI